MGRAHESSGARGRYVCAGPDPRCLETDRSGATPGCGPGVDPLRHRRQRLHTGGTRRDPCSSRGPAEARPYAGGRPLRTCMCRAALPHALRHALLPRCGGSGGGVSLGCWGSPHPHGVVWRCYGRIGGRAGLPGRCPDLLESCVRASNQPALAGPPSRVAPRAGSGGRRGLGAFGSSGVACAPRGPSPSRHGMALCIRSGRRVERWAWVRAAASAGCSRLGGCRRSVESPPRHRRRPVCSVVSSPGSPAPACLRRHDPIQG